MNPKPFKAIGVFVGALLFILGIGVAQGLSNYLFIKHIRPTLRTNQPAREASLSGISPAFEYHSTTTANGTPSGDYIITATPGGIGEITVASSSGSTFTVLDANGINTTTIATLKAGINEGTYVFNRLLLYGLVIRVPATFSGQYITNYRP